jgi:stage II sporulation protein M
MLNFKREERTERFRYIFTAAKYVYSSRNFIYLIAGIFFVSLLFGFIFENSLGSLLDPLIRSIINKTENLKGLELAIFIFLNNSKVALMGLFLGVIFGIPSVLSMMFNGITIGYVLKKVLDAAGIVEFWKLFPHGIFELPAIFIAMGLGLKLGMFVFDENRKLGFQEKTKLSFMVYVFIILPLLVVASIIESLLIFWIK